MVRSLIIGKSNGMYTEGESNFKVAYGRISLYSKKQWLPGTFVGQPLQSINSLF